MGQHDGPAALAVKVGVDEPPITGRERDVLLGSGATRQEKCRGDGEKSAHGVRLTFGSRLGNLPQRPRPESDKNSYSWAQHSPISGDPGRSRIRSISRGPRFHG